MLKQLYHYILRLAGHKHAPFVLFAVAFIESSFFPIPPDVLLIPMIMARFDRAFMYAAICTAGSVVGGLFGYLIGMLFADTLGHGIVSFYGAQEQFELLQHWYNEQLWVVIGAAGFSPIPYKIFTILSGMLNADLITFLVASVISRGARFFLIGWLLWRGGPKFKVWIESNFYPFTMVTTIVLIALIVVLKVVL